MKGSAAVAHHVPIGLCGNPAIQKPMSAAGVNSGLSELEISQRQELVNT